jgi:hypothetical protein
MMMSLRPLIRLTWLAPVLALAACGAQVAPLVKPTLPAHHWQAALPASASTGASQVRRNKGRKSIMIGVLSSRVGRQRMA